MTSTSTRRNATNASNLVDRFDRGEDVLDYFDTDHGIIERPDSNAPRRVNVDFPQWMVDGLDRAAAHLGINRQAIIKTWIADRLKEEHLV